MIGAGGRAAGTHYPSLHDLPNVEIAAVCELSEQRLNAIADKYEIEARFSNKRWNIPIKILDEQGIEVLNMLVADRRDVAEKPKLVVYSDKGPVVKKASK